MTGNHQRRTGELWVDLTGLRANPDLWKTMSEGANPAGRVSLAEDMAGAALYRASDIAASITGETINVSGGAQLTLAVDASRR